ncbi:uncharacterized protein LOC124156011 [Ischnura elegans]|uniref:uncharacterized protein LOC124156011 n=1 Tax=Ischnura elegans TaxID=197161 RepID=UPI001ED870DC|nr:uncharacterized protein LOC124156011 [Ischnura elegans]
MDSPRIPVCQQRCCPVETTARADAGRMKHTTKSSRKCCRLRIAATGINLVALLTLLLYLAPHCHSMPITTPNGILENWWHTPCGPIEETTTKSPIPRGAQMKSFRRTRTQLQLTHSHYNSLLLKSMYKDARELEGAFRYHWLPDAQKDLILENLERVDTNIREKAPEVLFQLHRDLQAFAVTLDKLYRHVHNEEHNQFGRKRARNLLELCLELKKLMCEVEESLSAVAREPPRPPLNSTYIPEDTWDLRPDKMAVVVQDWGILEKYGRFLLDWRSIVDKLLQTAPGSKKRKLRGKGQNKNRRRPKGKKGARKGQASQEEAGAANESAEERPNVGRGMAKRKAHKGERGERRNKTRTQRPRPPRPETSSA